jgi:hypothetical protein
MSDPTVNLRDMPVAELRRELSRHLTAFAEMPIPEKGELAAAVNALRKELVVCLLYMAVTVDRLTGYKADKQATDEDA